MIDARAEFIKASVWHGSLERSQAILAAHPEVATRDIFIASILGDDVLVRSYLASDPESATAKGAPLDWDALTHDGMGRTPLALAVRACVDSYWTRRRSPASVAALLNAGASVTGVMFPSGYAEVDELLQTHGAGT